MRILVPLAEGFEEIEAVTIIDILRRAGAEVIIAALTEKLVKGSHEITIMADVLLKEVDAEDFDALVLPGGLPGTLHLKESPRLKQLIQTFERGGKLLGAICAAPTVLEESGVIANRRVTSHPSVKEQLSKSCYTGEAVAEDGRIVTGRAAGAAMKFAFTLVRILFGPKKVEEVNKTVLAEL